MTMVDRRLGATRGNDNASPAPPPAPAPTFSLGLFDPGLFDPAFVSDRSSGRVIQTCKTCRRPPPHGDKLRSCARCQMVDYCGVECQRLDWPAHKVRCKQMGEDNKLAVAHQRADGKKPKHEKTLLQWYYTNPGGLSAGAGGLADRVMTIAWIHRQENPMIIVTTSASGADAEDPVVTMIPRSQWRDRGVRREYCDFMSSGLDDPEVGCDLNYYVDFDLHHPGSARWPMFLQPMSYPTFNNDQYPRTEKMEMLVANTVLKTARTFEERVAAVAHAETFLSQYPAWRDTFLASDGGVWWMFTGREQGGDPRVRITGLQSAASSHLNGRMGLILRRDSGASNGERRRVQVADGVEVGVKEQNLQYVDAAVFPRPP
mmetsp:Transcript_748/g.1737  ORF Transcript_748/g.1737 Transcript_748/m.1737 type:complete len:373 (-) Transcript_748:15-1133(-)